MKRLHLNTPLLESRLLSEHCGAEVYLKMDALQPSGSFKNRGVGFAAQTYLERGCKSFVAASGGNAGLAVAYAARKLGVPATIVLPESTSMHSRTAIMHEGARMIIYGECWAEAHAYAKSITEPDDAYIHPFDDPLLWEGHATLIDEVEAYGLRPDAVIVAVGGGGLLTGLHIGMQRNGWTATRMLAVETEGADCLARSVAAGRPTDLPHITSIATSLGTNYVCAPAFELAHGGRAQSVVVSDNDAIGATKQFFRDHRVAVEPACGAALSVVYDHRDLIRAGSKVLVVVCGGVGIRFADLT